MTSLGNWTVLDIETTGISASEDSIIDIGFLEFDGTKLVKKYSSLVRYNYELSEFIQKLTGISNEMVNKAPHWSKSEVELHELAEKPIIAHNSDFEKSFLNRYFEDIDVENQPFCDSLLYLSLLFPGRSKLGLESFLIDFGLADFEHHRGYEDSVDLLKVMLFATYYVHEDKSFTSYLKQIFYEFDDSFWFKKFFSLDQVELIEIGNQIDFDVLEYVVSFKEKLISKEEEFSNLESIDLSFSGKNISTILEDERRLSTFFPGYKFRSAQQELSLKVGQSFNNNIHSLIQAPTGTGKTLGYLVPSALYSMSNKVPVLVATGTKTLQKQALEKDVPQLHKILGANREELKVVKLIGSNNHLCELAYRNEKAQPLLLQMGSFEERFAWAYLETVFYVNDQFRKSSRTITREDIPYVLKKKNTFLADLDKDIAVDYRACTSQKCPFKASCTYLNGYQMAKEADLIIGNHSLLLHWPQGNPKPTHLVIDEAHRLENEATRAYSLVLTQKDIENFSKNIMQMFGSLFYLIAQDSQIDQNRSDNLKNDLNSSSEILRDQLNPLFQSIELLAKRLPNFTEIFDNELKLLGAENSNNELEVKTYNFLESVKNIYFGVLEAISPYYNRWELESFSDDNDIVAWSRFENSYGIVHDSFAALSKLLENDDNYASTIKFNVSNGFTLESSPIDVGSMINEKILKESDSVVFTSATLANHKGSIGMGAIEWMTGYRNLEPQKRFKSGFFIDNHFDYKENARVYLCQDTKAIYDSEYVPDVLSKLIPLMRDIGGRTLLLFSSRVRFEKAVEILLKNFKEEIPIFVQGLGNNVVEDFKDSANGILVGMESFSEGIDIPGRALELVYVDKIPDLRREFVIDKRREFFDKQFGNEFTDYFLSTRARALHQKLGRLIRRDTDKGGIIITDSRTKRWKGRTLGTFRELMEPYNIEITNLSDAVEKFKDFHKSL